MIKQNSWLIFIKYQVVVCVFLTILITLMIPILAKDRPNVLLLCVDDLRPELASFGVDYIHSPNIDALAASGRIFQRHYVQAPTCGASRFTLLTGTYGSYSNQAIFQRAEQLVKEPDSIPPSLPKWFKQHGYTTVSVGKVSHHPGGRGGTDWDDPSQLEMPDSWDRHLMPSGAWLHPRGAMHGLSHGEIREKASDMDVFQSNDGPDTIYPDGLIMEEALKQLNELAESEGDRAFFLAVGIIRPHLPFGAPAKYMQFYRDIQLPPTPHTTKPEGKTTWHLSNEFKQYNLWGRDPNQDADFAVEVRKHYAACVTYADALIGRILARLDELNLRDDTVIVLWGDHGWHLGEHAVWGKHTLFEESLRSPLIISHTGIPYPGKITQSMVETIDIFPTLCDLVGLPTPGFLDGTSLVPILKNPQSPGHSAIAYQRDTQTIRTDTYRLIVHQDGHLELYDHRTPEAETRNLSQSDPVTANKLLEQLRLKRPSESER